MVSTIPLVATDRVYYLVATGGPTAIYCFFEISARPHDNNDLSFALGVRRRAIDRGYGDRSDGATERAVKKSDF
jgi:hypothetical protein